MMHLPRDEAATEAIQCRSIVSKCHVCYIPNIINLWQLIMLPHRYQATSVKHMSLQTACVYTQVMLTSAHCRCMVVEVTSFLYNQAMLTPAHGNQVVESFTSVNIAENGGCYRSSSQGSQGQDCCRLCCRQHTGELCAPVAIFNGYIPSIAVTSTANSV